MIYHVFLQLVVCAPVVSWPYYAESLPNGDNAPNPCNPSKTWIGLGHLGPLGSGPRNQFGLDFLAQQKIWTKELCMMDSDGDGRSNGLELGDPDCLWTRDNGHKLLPAFSNPGVCDPWDSPHCRSMNGSITCDKAERCETIKEPGMERIDFRLNQVLIPDTKWTFACQIFDLPTNGNYHMIAGQPIIDRSAEILGGIGVFGCDEDYPILKYTGRPFHCSANPMPPCQELIAVVNSEHTNGTCLPYDVGINIGLNGYKQVLLRWIFVNPKRLSGIVSTTGMSIYYTPKLRDYNAGVGVLEETHFIVPPKLPAYKVSTACPSHCTERQMTNPITVISGLNIMNRAKQDIQIYRNGKVINSITDDNQYNMFYPKIFWYDTPVPILPGDMLKMSCEYNSLLVNGTTKWGLKDGEVCKGAILYYPKENWIKRKCKSFRTVPLCGFETGDRVYGCSLQEFQKSLFTLPVYKDLIYACSNATICSDYCFDKVSSARRTPCLTGDLYYMWQIAGKTGSMSLLYKALEACESRFDSTGGFWGSGKMEKR
ncbi:hypothetical protein FSP39_006907 [Pinctada imbricata]|uniref:Temptin n=1 Tax=Pinctada imbricata TaxID=66713 RepID=A0AA89C6U1_PINIB|nr:hypothetical protein FSP39_006907 [Pinctada imbricata]